jgi:hypothetical protein
LRQTELLALASRRSTKLVAWRHGYRRSLRGDDVYTLSGQVLRGTVEVFVSVQNASAEPVWNLVVKVPRVEPEGTEEVAFPIVPPETVIRHRLDWTPPDDYAPVEILFRDNRGSEWTRSDVSPGLVQRALPARP